MSNTIDSRVVEMRFDNSHFEKNVSTTMSTLDKLKQKLHLDGATKGLENIDAAAKKVNVSGLGSAVETVGAKFSAMEVIGITALANITNSAVNAGKRIVSALTIDPVRSGFSEYEMKMDSIKTIVNSTSRPLEDVNKLLNELNEYSDQTIYSFKDMTQNIGKFTNAGVKLEDAVLAIKGISNEAAVSGANAQEASRAMYNFSQALSAGYVKLIDWKSIENANMATKEFKQQLIDTAVELDVITKNGDMYTTSTGKSFNATKNFNDVLQEQWMTTDVLIKTLGKYADSNTVIGKKAFAAAQEVTKLSQMWDVLKETAQSGWAKTWELIVGDLESAKAIFTPLTNLFSGIVESIDDTRNRILEVSLHFTKPWSAMIDKFKDLKKVTKNITKASDTIKYFQKVVNDVWKGNYKNSDTGRYELLEKAGYDHRVVQDLVNIGRGYKLTIEDIEASHKKFGLTMETTTEETQNLADSVNNLSDADLEKLELTEEEIRLYRALEKEAKKHGITVTKLAEEMSEAGNGRELMINAFKDLGKVIGDTFSIAKESYGLIFNPPSVEEIGIKLYGVIRSFSEYAKSVKDMLLIVDEANGVIELTETGDKLMRTFKGIFAAVDIVATVVAGPLKIAFKLIIGLLKALDIPILDVTANIGDAIVAFNKWLDSILDFEGMFRTLFAFFKDMPKHIKDWFASFKDSKIIKAMTPLIDALKDRINELVGAIKNTKVFKSIGKFFAPFFDSVKSWINSLKEADNIPKYIFDGLIKGLKDGATRIWKFVSDIFVTLIETVENVLGIASPSKVFIAIGGFIVAGLIAGLKDGMPKSLSFIKDFFQPITDYIVGLDIGGLFVKGMGAVGGLAVPIGKGIGAFTSKIFEALKAGIQPTIDFLKHINFGDILSKAIGIGTVAMIYKLSNAIGSVGKAFYHLGDFLHDLKRPIRNVINGFAKVEKAFAFNMRMDGIKTLVTSLLMLVAAIVILTFIDTDKLWNAFYVVAAITGLLAALVVVTGIFAKTSLKLNKSGIETSGLSAAMLSIGAAILMIGAVVAIVGKLKLGQAIQGFVGVAAIMAAMIGFMKLTGKFVDPKNMKTIVAVSEMLNYLSKTIIKFALVAILLGYLNPDKINQGIDFISLFMIMIGILMWSTKWLGDDKKIKQMGEAISNISKAIMIMALTAALLGYLDPGAIGKGTTFMLLFVGMIIGLMAATRLIVGNKSNQIEQFGKAILGIAGAIAIMAGIAVLLGYCDPGAIGRGTTFMLLFAGMMVGLMAATRLLTGGYGKQVDQFGKTILYVAGAIAIMAGLAIILGYCDPGAIGKGTTFMLLFAGMIVGLMAATRLLVKNNGDLKQLGIILVIVAGVITILAGLAILLGYLDPGVIGRGTTFMIIFCGMLVGLMAATRLLAKNNNNIKQAGVTLLILVGVIALMAAIVIALSELTDPKTVWSYVGALIVLAGSMTGLLAILSVIGKKADVAKQGVWALLALAAPLAAFAAILVGMRFAKHPAENAVVLTAMAYAMTGLLAILSVIGKKADQALKGVWALTALAVPLVAFAGVLILMNFTKNPAENAVVLTAMAYAMTGLLAILSVIGKKADQALSGIWALTAMAVPLLAFAAVLVIVGSLNIVGAIPNVIALSILCGAMTLLMIPLSALGNKADKALKGIWALTAMAVPLLAFAAVLAIVGRLNVTDGIPNVIALSLLCGVMTLLLKPLSKVGKSATKAVKSMIALTALAVPLAAFGLVLAMMSALNVTDAIPNIIALTLLTSVMTLLLIPLALIGSLVSQALLGVVALVAMAVPLVAFVGVLALMSGIENAVANAQALALLATVMTILLIPLCLIGTLIAAALLGVVALTAMVVPLVAFVGVLALMAGIDNAMTNAMALVLLITAVGDVLVKISLVAPLALIAVGALAALLGVMIAFGAFAVAIGALVTLIPQLETFIDTGIPIMVKLADGLGQMIGAFISAVAGAIMDLLPQLGMSLGLFMTNATPFIVGMKMVDESMVSGVKRLAETILILTGTKLLDSLTSWLTGGNALEDFANQLPILGRGLAAFRDSLGTFTEAQLATVNCAAEAIKTLASAADEIPNSGGWVGKLLGNNDLGTFAAQFPVLGDGIAKFLGSVGTLTSGQNETITCAAEAIKTLASAANEIPNSGGWVGAIVGENDMGTFADQFPLLGAGLSGLVTSVGGSFTQDNLNTVSCAADAVKALASAANSIPNSGGWLSKLFGGGSKESLATFAANFPKVGEGLAGFATNLGTFSDAQVSTVNAGVSALNAIARLGELNLNSLNNSVATFGTKLSGLGKKLGEFCKNMPATSSTIAAVNSLDKILESAKKIADVNSGTFSTFADNLKKVSKDAVSKFVNAFTDSTAKTNIESHAKDLAGKAVTGASSKATGKDSMESAGKDLGSGLVIGIDAKQDAAYDAGYRLGQKAVQGEKDGQASNSPSKLTIQAGKWIGEGLVVGMGKMGNSVYKSGYTLGETATNSISSTISRISDMVNTDIDSQPTIRPVLDLSDVRAGANTLSGMLDMNSSVGVNANIGAITSMMSTRGQNGANADVVSALDKLSNKMDNLGNTSYQINGITYDDGSNIRNAIETITREAIRGRRM